MRDGAKTRERILAQALRLFVEQGFAETTTRDIAKAAGITEGAIYRHFESKDEIGWELFHANYAIMAARLEALIAANPDFRAALKAIIVALCRLFDSEPDRFRYLLLAQHNFLSRVTAETPSPIKVLRGLIGKAIAAGEIGIADAPLATAIAQGPLLIAAQSVVYGAIPPPLAAAADAIYAATLRAVDAR